MDWLQRYAFGRHKLGIEIRKNNTEATLALLKLLAPIRRWVDKLK